MAVDAISIRPARRRDADVLASVHDAAWRGAYLGILGGIELERLIARRGSDWWEAAIRYRTRISLIEVAGVTAGYVTGGRSRMKTLPFASEIYELYLLPEYQGLGFGKRLFAAARADLRSSGLKGLAVRVLAENTPACAFYETMGGKLVSESLERLGTSEIAMRVYGWSDGARR